jgi:hypothetical protein
MQCVVVKKKVNAQVSKQTLVTSMWSIQTSPNYTCAKYLFVILCSVLENNYTNLRTSISKLPSSKFILSYLDPFI